MGRSHRAPRPERQDLPLDGLLVEETGVGLLGGPDLLAPLDIDLVDDVVVVRQSAEALFFRADRFAGVVAEELQAFRRGVRRGGRCDRRVGRWQELCRVGEQLLHLVGIGEERFQDLPGERVGR